jgi:hypothetical protein
MTKPPAGVNLGKKTADEMGADPKDWESISPDTESVDADLKEMKGKCIGKNPTKPGKAVYTASFSAGTTDIRGKVTFTLAPICADKNLAPVKLTVFVDGTNAQFGFDADKSDYTGDGKANQDKPKPKK